MDALDAPDADDAPPAADANLPLTFLTADTAFRLFDLPRELRDQIYDHSLTPFSSFTLVGKHNPNREERSEGEADTTSEQSVDDTDEAPKPPRLGLIAGVEFRPATNILLASRVLAQEYEERSKLAITLVLRDNERYSFQPVTLPEPAKEVYWAELHLILFCHNCRPVHVEERSCQAALEIAQHKLWIEKLLSSQLPKLRSFSIHAYLCYDPHKPSDKKSGGVPCEAIVQKKIQDLYQLPKLKTLTLYKYSFLEKPELDGPKVMLLEWPAKPEGEMQKTAEEMEVDQETPESGCHAEHIEHA